MTVERPVEIELKYAVADRTVGERLLNADSLAGFRPTGAPHATQHEDRYVDSADGALTRAGFAARLRTSASGTLITLKSTAESEGSLHRREELEGPADRTSEVANWPASAARSLILELCGDAPLVELVTIRQFRRRRDLELPGAGAAVELSLDEVDVVSHGRVVERFLELELELVRGSVADLAPLQALLDGHHGLSAAPGSKLERALLAARAGRSGPAKAAASPPVASTDRSEPSPNDSGTESKPVAEASSPATDTVLAAEEVPAAAQDRMVGSAQAMDSAPEASADSGEPADTTDEVEAAADGAPGAADKAPVEADGASVEADGASVEADGASVEADQASVPQIDGEADEIALDEPSIGGAPDVLTFGDDPDMPDEDAPGGPEASLAVAQPESEGPVVEAQPKRPVRAHGVADVGRVRTPEDGPVEGAVIDLETLEHTPELIDEAEAAVPLVLGSHAGVDEIGEIPVGKTPGVTADDLHAEAGRKVLRFHLARMIAREPGTREGKDPEELHGMRVSTRRMRAAWRVFGDGFRDGRTAKFQKRLRSVAARLGTVRDLDVLIDATEEFANNLPSGERDGLEPLIAAWRDQRDAGRRLLVRELDSDGHRRFVEDYRDFVLTPGADVRPVDPTSPHRVRDTAGSRIWSAYERVRAYESVLKWADVPTLHQLRIEAKRLRYTLEFVREALGPEAPALISRVVALQDHLGAMNDAEVGANMARAYLVAHAGELSDSQSGAISRYLVAREREVARLKRSVGVPWRGVSGPTFRRALGRTLAAL
jgi:CHAD domain-containing protein